MKDVGIVYGSKEQAVPLVIGMDTVYVHTDIEPVVETDRHTGRERETYRYHEIQYTKDEYIKLLADQNNEISSLINALLGVNE